MIKYIKQKKYWNNLFNNYYYFFKTLIFLSINNYLSKK